MNSPFRGLMESLGHKDLESQGGLWKEEGEESMVYRFGKERWEEVKRPKGSEG